jgi:hypothetical protein
MKLDITVSKGVVKAKLTIPKSEWVVKADTYSVINLLAEERPELKIGRCLNPKTLFSNDTEDVVHTFSFPLLNKKKRRKREEEE